MANADTINEIDLGKAFFKLVLAIKQNFKIILLIFLGGMMLGFAYGIIGTKIYETKMMITSDILTESYSEKLINNLTLMIKEENNVMLASKLGVKVTDAEQIASIGIESAVDDRTLKEEDKRWFLITVQIKDQSIIPQFEKGLLNYLGNNEYVKIRIEQRRRYFGELIKKIDNEISSLETLKSNITSGALFASAKGNIMFDVTEVNSKIIELNKEKYSFQNNLELASSVQLVEGFTKFNKPIKPNKILALAAGTTFGLFCIGLLFVFKSTRRLIKIAEQQEQN